MGKTSIAKGRRRERELAKLLGGQRVPLSGSAGGDFGGDVLLPDGLRVEVKARRDGFRQLYGWLDGADLLALKADRRPWLVVLTMERFMGLVRGGGGR